MSDWIHPLGAVVWSKRVPGWRLILLGGSVVLMGASLVAFSPAGPANGASVAVACPRLASLVRLFTRGGELRTHRSCTIALKATLRVAPRKKVVLIATKSQLTLKPARGVRIRLIEISPGATLSLTGVTLTGGQAVGAAGGEPASATEPLPAAAGAAGS